MESTKESNHKKVEALTLWCLQNVSRDTICKPFYDFSVEKPPRLFSCYRFPVDYPQTKDIDVLQSLETKNAYYTNLQTCGSVWTCPICAVKITTQRQKKLRESMNFWLEISGCHKMLMVTFTMPHTINQKLSVVRESFMSSRRRMRRQKALKRQPSFIPYSEICENFGIVGDVTNIELTYGANGWHLHSHQIFFCAYPVKDVEKLRHLLVLAWKKALISEKVAIENDEAFFKRSVDVENVDQNISQYVSKVSGGWNSSHEMTKSHTKKGRLGSLSPFDILRQIVLSESKKERFKLKNLYRQFARNMFGKQQLFFSKGMAAYLYYNIDDVVDDIDEISELLGSLSHRMWEKIRKNHLRGKFLSLCECKGFKSAFKFLEAL